MSRALVYTELVPELLTLLEETDEPAVVSAAALALGACVDAELAGPVHERLVPLLTHGDAGVESAATLTLGLLGHEEARDVLEDVARGELTGVELVPRRQRALAALALGLADLEASAALLLDLALHADQAAVELRSCAILGLGLMSGADSLAALDELAVDLHRPHRDATLTSVVAEALGRRRHRGALDALTDLVDDRDIDRRLRQSAVIALGRIARPDDALAVRKLRRLVNLGRDGPVRRLAWVSLARIALAFPDPVAHGDFHRELAGLMRRELRYPDHQMDRSWLALAAGMLASRQPVLGPRLVAALRTAYDAVSDPPVRAALALGLGLAGHGVPCGRLSQDLTDSQDDAFREHAVLSLGLSRCTEAAPFLRELADHERSPRESAVLALRLLGDATALEELVTALPEDDSLQRRRARALGLLHDPGALPALREVALDQDQDALTRAAACKSLGLITEKRPRPWRSLVTTDLNPLVSASLAGLLP